MASLDDQPTAVNGVVVPTALHPALARPSHLLGSEPMPFPYVLEYSRRDDDTLDEYDATHTDAEVS